MLLLDDDDDDGCRKALVQEEMVNVSHESENRFMVDTMVKFEFA